MLMVSPFPAIVVTLIAIAFGIGVRRLVRGWWRYGGQRVVTCPRDQRLAAVHVNAWRAAVTNLNNDPDLRLSDCSRWPERAGCDRQCVSQIGKEPGRLDALHMLTQWYDGKYCVSCGQPVGSAYWAGSKPALLTSDGCKEWDEIPVGRLSETLLRAMPLCSHCHQRLDLAGGTRNRPVVRVGLPLL